MSEFSMGPRTKEGLVFLIMGKISKTVLGSRR